MSIDSNPARTKPRKVLHMDLDAFFCAVEELLQPELKGKAFVVGGPARGRGVVSSASYAARRYGVRSAMPTAQAVRRCPDLIVVPPRHGVYGEHSDRVLHVLREAAPVVEELSIDEAFLDVTDDPRPGAEIAAALQAEIEARYGLPTSWGVAANKLVAKIATEVAKPHGIVEVPPGKEASFLAPLPILMLWGVGPKTQARLESLGVRTIGDLAALPKDRLTAAFGDYGLELASRARGEDHRPVAEGREPRSMSSERTFARDVSDGEHLRRALRSMSEEVGGRLRRAGRMGRTVRLKLRWPDFETITRQTTLPHPTDQDGEICRAAQDLFHKAWRRGKPVRLIGVGVADLLPPVRQLDLFDDRWRKDARLLAALDAIRARYGRGALRRGAPEEEDE